LLLGDLTQPDWYLALTVGLLLGAALLAGHIAQRFHLPRVTAYLLVGLALGPHSPVLAPVLSWVESVAARLGHTISIADSHIPEEHLHLLEPVSAFAMGLVLFNMGCHFPLARFRRIFKRLLPMSIGELCTTMVVVTGGLTLLGFVLDDTALNWQIAALFGALALATAPATTVLVLKESRSEGPITEFASGLLVLNNLAAIVIFELLFVLVHASRGGDVSVVGEYFELTRDLGVAALLGIGAGLALSFFCGLLPSTRWLVLLTAVIAPLMAFCELLNVPYLLTFLAMGTTLASASDLADDISQALDKLTGLLCVVFFAIRGADINLSLLWAAGSVGIAYIALRSAGKYFGIYFSADAHRDGPQVKQWLGSAMLSQAGAALALAAIAVERDEQLGRQLEHIILGTVVFFEIVGPILVRTAVLSAGEVPVADTILHTVNSPTDQLRTMAFRIMQSVGIHPVRRNSADQLDVARVMRRNVRPLVAAALFNEVIDHIEHSHDNTYPVVNSEKELIGIIRYPDIRDVLFDPAMKTLVTAEDLAVPAWKILKQDETLGDAWRLLKDGRDDCVPVVASAESQQYVGVVRRRDMLRLLSHKAGQEQSEN